MNLKKELRTYPTESTEFLECKTNNRMYAQVMAQSPKDTAMMSKLITLREQISTIGSPKEKVQRVSSEHVGLISPRQFGRRLDEKLPLRELNEIANYFSNNSDKVFSKNYVNEMLRLQQCIEKKLRK